MSLLAVCITARQQAACNRYTYRVRRLVVTGLEVNDSRPNNKLPYRGTWLQIGHDQVRWLWKLL